MLAFRSSEPKSQEGKSKDSLFLETTSYTTIRVQKLLESLNFVKGYFCLRTRVCAIVLGHAQVSKPYTPIGDLGWALKRSSACRAAALCSMKMREARWRPLTPARQSCLSDRSSGSLLGLRLPPSADHFQGRRAAEIIGKSEEWL